MGDEIEGDKYVFNNSKIGAVGRNAKSNSNTGDNNLSKKDIEKSTPQDELKKLLAENKIEACLMKLSAYLQQIGNKDGLNLVIHQSSLFHELKQKETFDLLPSEEVRLRKNKLIHAIIQIIDTSIGS